MLIYRVIATYLILRYFTVMSVINRNLGLKHHQSVNSSPCAAFDASSRSSSYSAYHLSIAIAQKENGAAPRLVKRPHALLLEGFEPFFLVTEAKTTKLGSPDASRNGFGYRLSPDGKRVTAVLSKTGRWSAGEPIEGMVSSLSVGNGIWTEYVSLKDIRWPPTINRDGSQLAFSAADSLHLFTIQTRTGQVLAPSLSDIYSPEWSPDGTLIAYEVALPQRDPHFDHRESEIRVLDLKSGNSRVLVPHGGQPKWAPSGEWIAYLDDSTDPGGKRCFLVHPDGTDAHIVAVAPRRLLGGSAAFWGNNVWSPDPSKLLLNVYWDWETLKTTVYELDLSSHRLSPVLKNAQPVWAWAESRMGDSE
jgi:Tol biopolymer transport system component